METTQVVNFRREVLRRIAEYTWNDCLPEHIYDILYNTVKDNTSRVRCCVHKERAVLKNRVQMALWQPLGLNIINAAKAALDGEFDKKLPVIDVLPDACDACPIDKYYVTDLCRHCIQHNCMNNCPKKPSPLSTTGLLSIVISASNAGAVPNPVLTAPLSKSAVPVSGPVP